MRAVAKPGLVIVALAALAPAPAAAADPAPPPPACAGAEHRQFDFWLGDWDVEVAGELRGRNRITRLHGDCGLREEYRSAPTPYEGSSLNLYDERRGVWHQTWMDNDGLLLVIEGGLRNDGAMVLEGSLPGEKGGEVLQRITWTPNPDGTVRQHWQTSADGGATWHTAFDGLYRRRAGGS